MKSPRRTRQIDVVIIGAGQSGLSVGYHLKRKGIPFVILEGHGRIGDSWRQRWDSLRLFTPAKFDGLAGMPYPANSNSFPTKDEFADFLEGYAEKFDLPVETGIRVERVTKRGTSFVVTTADEEIEASQVVVAMASYQQPIVPEFSGQLRNDIVQLHSSAYKNPSQLREGTVLIAGAGNSGAEIAVELSRRGFAVSMSGRDVGHVPFRLESFVGGRILGPVLLGFVFKHVMTLDTPMGRRAHAGGMSTTPLIRVKPKDLAAAGVARVARVAGVRGGLPILSDGQTVDASNVIWATGFDGGFSWIDLPVFDTRGLPTHRRGIVEREPGLYFIGLHFLYSMSSAMIQGAARDSAYISAEIARHAKRPIGQGTLSPVSAASSLSPAG